MTDPVYILIRTSNRPKFFEACMNSIKKQTYPNIITIVHSDDPTDEYVTGDIVIRGERFPYSMGTAPYNLYNNRLLDAIPDCDGWYHFIDDDDMYAAPNVIERLVLNSQKNSVNVGRVKRWNDTVWPRRWRSQNSFQTECFFLHTDHRNLGRWWSNKGGDHNYSKQLTEKLSINWIDNLLICEAQEGKGHGRRYDLGDKPLCHDSATLRPQEMVKVEFLRRVSLTAALRGNVGEIKDMRRDRAERLEFKGKVRIIKEEAAAV